jgi:hypothetical protein
MVYISAAQPSARRHFFACQGFSECRQSLFQNVIVQNILEIGYFTLISYTKLDFLSQIFARQDFLPQIFARLSKRLGIAVVHVRQLG